MKSKKMRLVWVCGIASLFGEAILVRFHQVSVGHWMAFLSGVNLGFFIEGFMIVKYMNLIEACQTLLLEEQQRRLQTLLEDSERREKHPHE